MCKKIAIAPARRRTEGKMLTLKSGDQLEYRDDSAGYNCNYEFPYLHTHDYWEFVYVKYDIEHVINGASYNVPANSVLIIRPTDRHLIRAIPNNKLNPQKSPTHLNVKITTPALEKLLEGFSPRMLETLSAPPILEKHLTPDLAHIPDRFLSVLMWNSSKEENMLMLRTHILYITSLFVDTLCFPAAEGRVQIPDEIAAIVKKMNSQDYLGCTIAQIVSGANYSHMQLSRLFKQYTGTTMHEYFLNIKLDAAATMLRSTNRLILDISNDIGITSLSHFNHIFKEKYGVSPSRYRKDRA